MTDCGSSGRGGRRETDLQHKLHADSVFDQSHHQVSFTLEHLVVLPGQRVGVLDGEVKVGSGTGQKHHICHRHTHYQAFPTTLRLNIKVEYLSFSLPPLKVGCNRTPPIFSS